MEKSRKRRLSDFSGSLFWVVPGLILVFAFRNPEPLGVENTAKIAGQLATFPEIGDHDGSDYIRLNISGKDDVFEFYKCSYDKDVVTAVKMLKPDDEVTLYVEMSGFKIYRPFSGDKYESYKIIAATSDNYGNIIGFNQYNSCNAYESNTKLPVIGFIAIIIGLFSLYKALRSNDTFMDIKYLNLTDDVFVDQSDFIRLKPDKWSYVIGNSAIPVILFIAALILDGSGNTIIVNVFLSIAGYSILHLLLVNDKVYYIIDAEGIHVRNVSYIFRPEITNIKFGDVKEVLEHEGFIDSFNNVGTIKIHTGQFNEDCDKVYTRMVGIKKYKEFSNLIKQKAGL